ncbi:RDD family protein [Candidatus Hydrogenedentota bacterium]
MALEQLLMNLQSLCDIPSSSCAKSTSVEYAGFGKQLLALMIDSAIFLVFVFPLCGVAAFAAVGISDLPRLGIWTCWASIEALWLYHTLFERSSQQATPGKKTVGIKVTDLAGNRISFGRAAVRNLCKLASVVTIGVGFVMIPFTQKRQALHDIMTRCVVVTCEKEPLKDKD